MADMQPAVTAKPPRQKRRLRKRWVVLIILVLLLGAVGGGGYAMRKTLTSPVNGEVVETLPISPQQTPIGLAQFDGTYFSFVHPETYIEQPTGSQKIPNELESHIFVSSGMVSHIVTIVVSQLPSGNLNDDSSYYMRTQDPARYHMKTSVIKNEKVITFTNNDGSQYEQTAFWAHGGKLMTFAMTGIAADTPSMTVEYTDMVNSVTWH